MPLPAQIARLIEEKNAAAMDGTTHAFNQAARRVFELQAGSGISSHAQARAALACLEEAERRLVVFTEAVKRILLAARHNPTEADQAALLGSFNITMDGLIALVERRGQADAGQSVMGRNNIRRALSDVGTLRNRLRHDFELMLVECANANRVSSPNVSIVYYLVGNNPRVTQGVDASTNSISVSPAELFHELRQSLNAQVTDQPARQQLLAAVTQLEQQSTQAGRASAYLAFVENSIQHLPVVTPFLPALAKWAQ
ncbi:MAG: hypothetical protein PSV13_07835 [Lacunisphaera sp.]|nr:hypothetical protein [Lacunisphaera sp.]